MAILNIPDLHDDASAEAAEDRLRAAQALLDDAWTTWCLLFVAKALRELPALDGIFIDEGSEFYDTRSRFIETRIKAASPSAQWPEGRRAFVDIDHGARQKMWTPQGLREMMAAERKFIDLAGDRRIEPFLRAAKSAPDSATLFQDEWGAWIMRGDDPIVERGLCLALGRPDLWARIEAGRMDAAAAPGRAPSAPPRI